MEREENKHLEGYYKVSHEGGTFVTGTFYNPITGDEKTAVLRDYDYADCSRDNDELYYMEIDKNARVLWLHKHGILCEGDVVEVYKGRKVPVGTIATIEKIKPFYDKYKRWCCDYAYLDNGMRTNVSNCRLAE